MKNAFLRKIISAGVVMSTMATLAPLGVSAQWRQSTDNTWIYLDCNTAVKGWKNISGNWYYFNSNGKMNTGWVYNNGSWYYNNNSGAMETGWVNVNGTWYYMNEDGTMKTGWIYYNGSWYYTDSTGAMQAGWINVNGTWYYMNEDGTMKTGWIYYNGSWYYADNTGAMRTGTVKVNGKTYNFDKSGVMQDETAKTISTNSNNTAKNNAQKNYTNTDDKQIANVNSGNSTKESVTNNASTSTSTQNNTNDNLSLNVNGLPQITQKYSATIQSNAEETILKLMNEKRTEAGLKPLTMDNTLVSVARYKSDHMIQNNYFDHTNPDGTNWTNWLKAIGYSYTATAENIAYNSYDPVELFNQWWNSSGHRQNMMNPSYTKVGIGVVYGNGKYMGTQEFSN